MDLLIDFAFKDIFRVDYPAARINDGEFASVPVNFAVLAVTGGAGGFVNNGAAALSQAVKECRFAHIGAPYDCY